MSETMIKTGAATVILGKKHYEGYFGYNPNKLLKVTKLDERHSEFKNISLIRTITNYKDYYIVPDHEVNILMPHSEFYNYLKILLKNYDMKIFTGILHYYYVDHGGSMDVMDSLIEFNPHVWNSAKAILKFSDHIMKGLKFLHERNIAHLDIKPENIVIDTLNMKFRIIDFGYSSRYPFDDFVNDIRGTPCYFPKYIEVDSDLGLPKIDANDLEEVSGEIPMVTNRNLVYKVDSYCFGRTLLIVYNVYKSNKNSLFENKTRAKIKVLIKLLLDKNVNRRLTIRQILALK